MIQLIYLTGKWGAALQIEYKNKSLKKVCTIANEAEKKHGQQMAKLIHLRIDQIHSFDSVEMLIQFKVGRCHQLTGNRNGQYAMDLVHPFRLIFKKRGDEEVQIVRIIDIANYH